MTDAEIAALADQAGTGDDAAWTQLYVGMTYQLKSWARRAGASPSELDDIANVVWLNLWRAMRSGKRFESGAKLMSYLAQCTRRQVIDLYRRTQVRPQCYSLEETDLPVLQSSFLFIELDGLTVCERRLVELLMSGYSVADIAYCDGLSCATIYKQLAKMRVHRSNLDS